ncbi:MAG: SURF1 family protein [Pseudomonadota bacterium]
MTEQADLHRPLWVDLLILAVAAVVFVTMVGLGNWQIDRLAWKIDLIERVEARAFQPPVELPQGPVSEDRHEYLRVSVRGTFQFEHMLQVKAVTDLGPGDWVMVPLKTNDGIVWVNRGFIPTGLELSDLLRLDGETQVEGLLRVTQAGGTLLEKNDPSAGRWVSRDVVAMSEARGLTDTVPYFIDADHAGAAEAWPRGGMTQLVFRNTHLSYALTWYTMAALFLAAMGYVIYERLRAKQDNALE